MPHLPLTTERNKSIVVNKAGVLKLILNLKNWKAPSPDQITKEMLVPDADDVLKSLLMF